ncbi:MAG TPA: cation diffusion facilitator family transporter [Bryobacteraceae bacterium]|nr:cation diffusion facilitator family transporter [Bryobacteraceae bacterium]
MERSGQADRLALGIRTTLTGAAVNILLAGAKAAAGVLGNSFALIADAAESLTDVVGSLVILGGLAYSLRPADDNHPYGHGKAEPLAAALVAGGLVGAALGIAYGALVQITSPQSMPEPYTLAVLAAVVLVKELMSRYVLRHNLEVGSAAVKTDAWHHRSDAITSALAFVGISIALIGGRGYESADDWAAVAAAVIILYNAAKLLREALSELTDEDARSPVQEKCMRVAMGVDGVASVEKFHVRKMGTSYYVDMHLEVDGSLSVRRGHEIAHAVKDAIRAADARVEDVLVHVEPLRGT